MKTKNWMMALIVALVSTAMAVAQTGESTMEGVPVVEEIMTDSNTDNQDEATPQTATKVGTWKITTYVGDSLDTTETIELTEEIFDDIPDFVKGLFGLTGLGIASGTILMVIIALLCIFGLPLILIFVLLLLIFRRRKQDVSDNVNQPADAQTTATPDRTLFNKGVKNICLGVGLAIFLGIWMGDFGMGIGALIICIGIGELLVDYFSKR